MRVRLAPLFDSSNWAFLSQKGKIVVQETYKYRVAFSILHG